MKKLTAANCKLLAHVKAAYNHKIFKVVSEKMNAPTDLSIRSAAACTFLATFVREEFRAELLSSLALLCA